LLDAINLLSTMIGIFYVYGEIIPNGIWW